MNLKRILLLTALVMCFSLFACGESDFEEPGDDSEEPIFEEPEEISKMSIVSQTNFTTALGLDLDTWIPAWGGHQNRLVRTKDGVFAVILLDSGDTNKRDFGVYRVDTEVPEYIGGEIIAGTAISLVSNKKGELYVLCLTTGGNVRSAYGAPTAYKFVYGQEGFEKIMQHETSMWNSGGHNYEAVSIDNDGNILFLMPRVGDHRLNAKFIYTTFDTSTDEWNDMVLMDMPIAYLYPYILVRKDLSINLVAQIGTYYEYLGLEDPSGKSMSTFLVNSLKLWNFKSLLSNEGITEQIILEIPVTDEDPRPQVQNSSAGDSYIDTLGYTHVLTWGHGGVDPNYNAAMMYYVYDGANKLIHEELLFTGHIYARFIESKSGNLYLITNKINTKLIEVFKANDDHKGFNAKPVFVQELTVAGLSTYSGLSVASPRGGTPLEDYVDCVYPADSEPAATSWVYFRLQLE